MSENLAITKEQLVSLLKAAHAAYKGQTRPPDSAGTEWISWYVDHVVSQLNTPNVPDTGKLPQSVSADKISTAKLPDLPESSSKPESAAPATTEAEPDAAKPEPSESKPVVSESKPAAPTVESAAVRDSQPSPSQPAAQTNALQVCPTCAHRNRPGVLFCDNCGTNLLTGSQASVGTRDLREAQEIAASSVNEALSKPKQQTENLTLGETEVQAVRTAGSSTFAGDMVLRIEVDGGATPIVIKPKAEDMILGRRDPTTGATPEVDLTSYAGYRMGVSRRHASLALENNRLNLWDLGSSNGTFINGTRLTPHQPSPLRDGDEVRLGQMVLRLFFQKSTPSKEATSS